VTSFQVDRAYLERYEVHQVGGREVLEYWIPAEELTEFNSHLVGAIIEVADYRAPVPDQQFDQAQQTLGYALPDAWRTHLQSPSWLRRGYLESGDYIWLYTPHETLDLRHPEKVRSATHPGIAIIGGDGAQKHLVLDLRRDPDPVLLIDICSDAWDSAVPQADNIAELTDRIEAGTFTYKLQ
jgi:hypothetical protein